MKISLKQIIAAGALVTLSSVALADSNDASAPSTVPDTTPLPSTNSGGLQLMIFSTGSTTWSLSQYLGLTLDQVLSTNMDGSDGAGLTLTWTISGLSSAISASGVSTSDLRWGVNAADTGALTTAADNTIRLVTTVDTSTGVTDLTNNQIQNATQKTATVVGGNNATANATTPGQDINTSANAANNVQQQLNYNYGAASAFAWAGDLTDVLAMYLYGNSGNTLGGEANANAFATQYAGTWTLDAANSTLTYSVAAVPLPAAVWLLLSGLGGLGVIGRRRMRAA